MASLTFSKRSTYFVVGAIYFMGGIEYAVILPSLWLYIHQDFSAQPWVLGLMLASFSASGLLAAPILGRLSDKTRKTRYLLLVACMFEIGGNVMYFMGLSLPFLVASRLISGVGTGGESVIMGEIARFTAEDKRTGIISILIAVRQVGLLFGPGLNFFLREADFHLGIFRIDKFTSPGALMTMLWIALLLLILFLYWEPEEIYKAEQRLKSAQQSVTASSSPEAGVDDASDRIAAAEERIRTSSMREGSPLVEDGDGDSGAVMFSNNHSRSSQYGAITSPTSAGHPQACSGSVGTSVQNCDQDMMEKTPLLGDPVIAQGRMDFFCNEYIREEVIVLLLMQFNSIFNQVCYETFITPLTDKFLQWGEFENSIMYSLAGVEIILVFLLLRWVSRHLQDRTLIAVGGLLLLAADVWSLCFLPRFSPDSPRWRTLLLLTVAIVLDMVALPPLMVCSVSLLSKITRKETQGLTQGLRRSVVGMGTILAPLWAGSTLPWLLPSFGTITALMALAMILLMLSFSRLRAPGSTPQETQASPVSS